jgi:LacI family transcriptional regulator
MMRMAGGTKSGGGGVNAKAPTVYDVADHAGVSIATVSRVLRRPEDVRESTRERVLASVRALGYVPSASARGLAARRTGVIGLFFPDFDAVRETSAFEPDRSAAVPVVADPPSNDAVGSDLLYFDEVLRGAEIEAWRNGFVLLVGVGRGSDSRSIVNDIAGRVDGLAVLAGSVPDELLEHISRRIPVVLIAGPRRDDDFDHVGVDNRAGMRALVEHVFSVREPDGVLYIRGIDSSPDDIERFDGFSDALAALPADERPGVSVLSADFSRERARDIAAACAEARRLPDAVVCANDQMALGVLDAFAEHGVRVPGKVLVAGFDGIDAGRHSTPRLTTVRQPMEDLGRAAVHVLTDRLANPSLEPVTLQLPVRVLVRESTSG